MAVKLAKNIKLYRIELSDIKRACYPTYERTAGSAFSTSGSFASYHFQFYNIDESFMFAFGAKQREFNQNCFRIYFHSGFCMAYWATNPY